MKKITRVPSLPRRSPDANKGDFGHVLIVGGAVGMSGAVALAGRAAARGGAGLVTIATAAHNQPIVAALVPEPLTVPLPQRPDGRIDPGPAGATLRSAAGRWTVLAAGCGWGTADDRFARDSVTLIGELAARIGGPTVLDADGLNLLATCGDACKTSFSRDPKGSAPSRDPKGSAFRLLGQRLILTPHPGEMSRLLDRPTKQIQADRVAAAAEAVERFRGAIVVLKGAGTVVTDGQRYYLNTTGNPGMATGGTGDVLTGLLAGLLAQGLDPFDAAVLAVYLHGLAGDLAARKVGMASLIAGDLVDFLGAAIMRHQRGRR